MRKVRVIKEGNITEMDVVNAVILTARQYADSDIIKSIVKKFPFVKGENHYPVYKEIFEYVRGEVSYCFDPEGIEDIKTPNALFREGCGDCDDFTTFWIALNLHLGVHSNARLVDWEADERYDHIYAIAIDLDGNSIVLDSVTCRFNYQEPYQLNKDTKIQA